MSRTLFVLAVLLLGLVSCEVENPEPVITEKTELSAKKSLEVNENGEISYKMGYKRVEAP